MYISQLRIENFKCFKDVTFKFDQHFNLIIGGNNVGKSTMMEAIRMWHLAFNKFLKDRTNNNGQSSFRVRTYYSFTLQDLDFLRIADFKKLFHGTTCKTKITVELSIGEVLISLPIVFTLSNECIYLRFNLCKDDVSRVQASTKIIEALNKPIGTSLKNLIFISYINPIFHLPTYEPKYTKGYILSRLHHAEVESVLRNLIEIYAPKEYKRTINRDINKHLDIIEKRLHSIIKDVPFDEVDKPFITFTSNYREEESENIEISALIKESNEKVELAQLGSGTINLLNILSVLSYGDYNKYNLSVLLLDEPDSHLHANHQKKLFDFLKEISLDSNKQMFIITHNHELIDCVDNVLYIPDKHDSVVDKISRKDYYEVYSKLAPEYYEKMLEIAQKQEIEEQLKNITKPHIFVEGSSDVAILQDGFKKLYNKDFFEGKIGLLGGGGASGVNQNVRYSNASVHVLGVLDSDKEGYSAMTHFAKNVKIERRDDGIIKKSGCDHYLMTLPVPEIRKAQATWFEKNCFIEYLFNDETLRTLGVELENELGTTFFKIKSEKDLDSQKKIIHENLNKLKKEDYQNFRPLFEKISELFNIPLE